LPPEVNGTDPYPLRVPLTPPPLVDTPQSEGRAGGEVVTCENYKTPWVMESSPDTRQYPLIGSVHIKVFGAWKEEYLAGCGLEGRSVTASTRDTWQTLRDYYGRSYADGFSVRSEPGLGTTFEIYLPRHVGAASVVTNGGGAVLRGTETVLVVEDEPAVLRIAKRMLGKQGYRVLTAATPGEATRLVTAHASEIRLLITDVIMPETNGQDLAKSLLRLRPGLKCLFMSGYTADVIAQNGVFKEGTWFIQKPFSSRELGTKVREVLDESKGRW